MPCLRVLAERCNSALLGRQKGGKTFIHNDFYPGNLILGKNIAYGIDFDKAGLGSPYFDLALLWSAFMLPRALWSAPFSVRQREELRSYFLKRYCSLRGWSYNETRKKLTPFLQHIFLERAYDFAVMALKGWKAMNPRERKARERQILTLLRAAAKYL